MTAPVTGRASIFDTLEVIADPQIEVDAVRMGNLLVLREGPTHENIVEQLIKMFPAEHPDDVSAVVRRVLPNAPSLDNLSMDLAAASPSWVRGHTVTVDRTMSRRRMQCIGAVVATALLGLSATVYVALARANASPFETTGFLEAASAVNFQCELETDMVAACRNLASGVDWEVHATVGAEPTDPTVFRFWHGPDLGTLFIFKSTRDRERFPRMAAYSKLYPFMTSHDRFIVAATDATVARNIAAVVNAAWIRGSEDMPALLPKTPTPTDPLDEWPSMAPLPQMTTPSVEDGPSKPSTRSQAAAEAPERAPVADEARQARIGAQIGSGGDSVSNAGTTGTPRPRSTATKPRDTTGQPQQPTTSRPTDTPTGKPTSENPLSVTIQLPIITFGL